MDVLSIQLAICYFDALGLMSTVSYTPLSAFQISAIDYGLDIPRLLCTPLIVCTPLSADATRLLFMYPSSSNCLYILPPHSSLVVFARLANFPDSWNITNCTSSRPITSQRRFIPFYIPSRRGQSFISLSHGSNSRNCNPR